MKRDMYANVKMPLLAKMKHLLPYRMSLLLAVTFVPVCLISIVLGITTVVRTSSQVLDSFQNVLDTGMDQMQANFQKIDYEMDTFAADYERELTGEVASLHSRQMINRLEQLLQHSGEKGFVYLFDINTGKCEIRDHGLDYDAEQIEKMERVIRLLTGQEYDLPYAYRTLNGYSFLDTSYFYENYQIGFLFDLGSAVSKNIQSFYDSETPVYLRIYKNRYQLSETGELRRISDEWSQLTENTLRKYTLVWQGGEIPISTAIAFNRFYAYKQIPASVYMLYLMTILVALLLIPLFWWRLQKEVIEPLSTLEKAMRELQREHFTYRIENENQRLPSEMIYMMDAFDNMADEIEASKEKDAQIHKAQMDNLRLQVNPHMLLNSYNMIYSLAQSKNYECIQEYSLHLVDYFRYVLRKNDDMVLLQQEMKFVENYIDIQKIRFPNSFSSVYSMEEDCRDALIPPFLIQNFVENAMKYSLIPGNVVEVLINIRRNGDRIQISVSDTGKGIKPEILEEIRKGQPYYDRFGNKHIGIWNCRRRIEEFYKEEAKLSIVSTLGEGTQVFIDIPYKEHMEETGV